MRMRWVTVCLLVFGIAVGTGFTARATELNQEEGIVPYHSADYVRTLNRFASTDVDAAFYNPAGLAFMKRKGLHAQFSSQTLYVKRIASLKYRALIADSTALAGAIVGKLTQNYQNPFMGGMPKEYTAEIIAPVVPGFDAAYKGDNWAVYLDIAVMQAAPALTFEEGLPIMDWGALATYETTNSHPLIPTTTPYYFLRKSKATRNEYYVGGTVGASYKFVDWLAGALGARYIYAIGDQTLKVQNAGIINSGVNVRENPWWVDTELRGHGFGLILGLHFKPIDIINIGLKYEYYFPMIMKKKTNKFQVPGTIAASGQMNIFLDSWWKLPLWEIDPMIAPATFTFQRYLECMNPDTYKKVGKTLKVTYPQTLSMGFAVNIIENLKAETSGEITLRPYVDLGGRQSNWNLGYKVGQSFEWFFVPQAAVSVGYLYNDFGIKKSSTNELNARKRTEPDPLLTSHSVAGGFKILAFEWLDIDLAAMYMFFKKEQTDTVEFTDVTWPTFHSLRRKFDERRWSVAIGLTVHLFGGENLKKVDEYGILLKQ